MIDAVLIGSSITMTTAEADALAGVGNVRLVTCPNGRVIGGVGSVGLVEHVDNSDLQEFMAKVQEKRDDLAKRALAFDPAKPREHLYKFVRI